MDHTQQRPLCPHCDEPMTQLTVWMDDARLPAIFCCPACGKAFGAQLLRTPAPGEGEGA